MFVSAIEQATKFTRAIHYISRNYNSAAIHSGAATLFFVNSEGWALTCAHVARELFTSLQLGQKRQEFETELRSEDIQINAAKLQRRRKLEKKYGFSSNTLYESHARFIDCVAEGPDALQVHFVWHPDLDVALLHFSGWVKLLCTEFPVFGADDAKLKPGKYVCKLGFPFVEFTNFQYDVNADQLRWTNTGRQNSPSFPLEGMITRLVVDDSGTLIGFETSTPGLRGQSGGPVFDSEGKIWGMQVSTLHLDLDFDVDIQVMRSGGKTRVKDSPFLHVGHCLHVSALRDFMTQHGVEFQVG